MKKIVLAIDGMTCSACSSGLEKYLNKQDGVINASVNLVLNTASIEYDNTKLSLNDLNKFVENAGFESLGIYNFEKVQKNNSREKNRLIIMIIISIFSMYLSMSNMIGLPVIPLFDFTKFPINYSVFLFILSFFMIYLGRDVLKNGIKNLFHKTPNMDTLVSLGVFSSFLYSVYGTIEIINGNINYLHNLYYESTVMVLTFIKIGKYIEGKNKDKAKEALKKLVTITPDSALVLKNGEECIVTIDEIHKNDVLLCKPGEKIAVDGTIIEGRTHIDESFITGESVPIKREIGSKVIAGSINYEGTIKYKAEKIGKNSTVSEIVKMVSDSSNTKAPIAKIADKVSGIFVPIIICIAIIVFIIWFIVSKDLAFSINIFISVLLIACPCSLGLATPLAIVIASGLCSEKGILVKSGEALENSHKVKTVVFDKTGTLTNGALTVSKVFNYSKENQNKLICDVASIENMSEHPIAKAIVNYANDKKLKLQNVTNFKVLMGQGVSANIEDDVFVIGNRELLENRGIEVQHKEDEVKLTLDGNSVLFVAKNNKLFLLIGVKDTIREDVKQAIHKLKSRNINVVMLTGDNQNTARIIASEIGIEKIIAGVKPNQKAEEINKFKQNGLVMMCGDGINDSVGLITADVGVSVSNGTDIAIDSANIVLMNNNVDKVNDLITISSKTIKNIKQNLFWAFFYNLLMIPVAGGALAPFGIFLNPMIASLAMTLSSLTVVFNALRLKK